MIKQGKHKHSGGGGGGRGTDNHTRTAIHAARIGKQHPRKRLLELRFVARGGGATPQASATHAMSSIGVDAKLICQHSMGTHNKHARLCNKALGVVPSGQHLFFGIGGNTPAWRRRSEAGQCTDSQRAGGMVTQPQTKRRDKPTIMIHTGPSYTHARFREPCEARGVAEAATQVPAHLFKLRRGHDHADHVPQRGDNQGRVLHRQHTRCTQRAGTQWGLLCVCP